MALALCFLLNLKYYVLADVCGTESETETWHGVCDTAEGEAERTDSTCSCKGGKMHGLGWYHVPGARLYHGTMKDGEMDGLGWNRYANGFEQKGQWRSGKMHGPGLLIAPGGSYSGEFADDRPHGFGVQLDYMRQTYSGTFASGKRHGAGVFSMFGGFRYAGEFDEGARLGCGVSTMDGFAGMVTSALLGHESGGRWTACNRTLDCPLRSVYCSCWVDQASPAPRPTSPLMPRSKQQGPGLEASIAAPG